ncbi:hypothetical protein C8R47DRAFT_1131412 [Mycena vitilis]|nr:hypothetical protein C8R47DRAFT_1131412 [Mycena vitilis]
MGRTGSRDPLRVLMQSAEAGQDTKEMRKREMDRPGLDTAEGGSEGGRSTVAEGTDRTTLNRYEVKRAEERAHTANRMIGAGKKGPGIERTSLADVGGPVEAEDNVDRHRADGGVDDTGQRREPRDSGREEQPGFVGTDETLTERGRDRCRSSGIKQDTRHRYTIDRERHSRVVEGEEKSERESKEKGDINRGVRDET